MENLIQSLNEALADTFAMYYKTHAHHWNIKGGDFNQYHDYLGGLYEDLHAAVDDIAEKVQICGGVPLSALSQICETTEVDESAVLQDPQQIMADLSETNKVVVDALYNAFYDAEDIDDQGIMNFLADRIDKHGKIQWKINASQGLKTQQESYNIYSDYIKRTKL